MSNFSKYTVHATVKSHSKRNWTYDTQLNFTQCAVSKDTFFGTCCCRDKHENASKNKQTFCWHIILVLRECIDKSDDSNVPNIFETTQITNQPMILDSESQDTREPEYEVERILGQRESNGDKEYLIKWSGYVVKSSSWEKEENITNAQQCLDYYKGLLNNSKIHYVNREQAN